MESKFTFSGDVLPTEIAKGVARRILSYSEQIMLVEMRFAAGGIGTPHAHPHDQVTYILSGKFRFTNDGQTHDVGPGDSLRFAPDTVHGAVCLEDGSLIDVFTPCREDFLA